MLPKLKWLLKRECRGDSRGRRKSASFGKERARCWDEVVNYNVRKTFHCRVLVLTLDKMKYMELVRVVGPVVYAEKLNALQNARRN